MSAALLDRPGSEIDRLLTALAQHRGGLLAEAEAGYRAVLEGNPRQANALHLLGRLCLADGRAALAAGLLRRGLAERADHADGRRALAEAEAATALGLLRADRVEAALAAAALAVEAGPGVAEAWFAQGAALRAAGRPQAAGLALRQALALDPDHAPAQLALGNARLDCDDHAAAEGHLRAAIRLAPGLAEAHASLGFLLTSAGRLDEAVAACDAAISLRPGFARAYWNRSFAHLLAGRFEAGFEDYEWRKLHDRFGGDFGRLAGREWGGETLEGHVMLVHAEQGFGDSIQFARYLPMLAARGARVVLACARPLLRLLGRIEGVAAVVDRARPLPAYDVWVDQMSLPRLFGTRLDSVPAAGGYLPGGYLPGGTAPLSGGRLRVGVVWAGNPGHHNDARRSVPFAALRPLLERPGIDWVSLQVGAREADRAGSVVGPAGVLADFSATAAAIEGLDLVIAVDTATAHLAGAMGRAVWVLLPFAPDWRWLCGRPDSPWYRSMRLFRQGAPGDWAGVIGAVAAALDQRVSQPVMSVPMPAAAAVARVPQTRSTAATAGEKPRRVARLVRS